MGLSLTPWLKRSRRQTLRADSARTPWELIPTDSHAGGSNSYSTSPAFGSSTQRVRAVWRRSSGTASAWVSSRPDEMALQNVKRLVATLQVEQHGRAVAQAHVHAATEATALGPGFAIDRPVARLDAI